METICILIVSIVPIVSTLTRIFCLAFGVNFLLNFKMGLSMHESHFLDYEDSRLHYTKSGDGAEVLLTFHGFGQSYSAFDPIIAKLKDKYTIYSFDIYYHGKSHWLSSGKALTKEVWRSIILNLCQKHDINSFSMLCFSMGGKFVLATTEMIPNRVAHLIMLAPDGIKTSMWYNLATYPIVFQSLFKSMIVRPQRFFGLLSFFRKLRLVDKGISKFATSQMNSAKKRRRVFYSWVVFKDFVFQMQELAQIINKNDIRLIMVLGKHDKIITEKGMGKLLRKLNNYKIVTIESGHNDLIKRTSQQTDLIAEF